MAQLEHTFNVYASFKQARRQTHRKFENRLKTFRTTIPLIIRFTEYNSFITAIGRSFLDGATIMSLFRRKYANRYGYKLKIILFNS
uniref:Uncharacterized protein n=1 Tax=Onchocerca volvulus TaxID=6282 RepID=A0A8R1Y5B6_ONCVO